MAGKPLDRFAGGVQYPLETPSKRNLRHQILGCYPEPMNSSETIIFEIVPIREFRDPFACAAS